MVRASVVSKTGFHIPSLDGLRAFSFGMVFASHAGLSAIVPGGFGVTVFFFLSGFLITTLMRTEFEKTGRVSFRNFYIRRALRILPPFYLVLAVATLLTACGVIQGGLLPRAVAAQAMHYANYWVVFHGFGGFPPGTGVYWSLAVEEHFYLLFPLVFVSMQRLGMTPRAQARFLLALCGVILCWRCALVFLRESVPDRTFVASDTRFDSILFGCILAIRGNPMLDPHGDTDTLWRYRLLPLGLLVLLGTFLIREPHFRETFRYTLQGLGLIPVFVCAMRYPTWSVMRLLNYRPVAFLGLLSYSLYLVHQVALYGVEQHYQASLGLPATAVLAFAISVGIAWLMYYAVDKPCAKLRRKFSA